MSSSHERVLTSTSCSPNAFCLVVNTVIECPSQQEEVNLSIRCALSIYMYWASMISRYLASMTRGRRVVLTGTSRIIRRGKTIFM